MRKKDALIVLKNKFIDPMASTNTIKNIKELYQEIKKSPFADTEHIPSNFEIRVKAIR